MLLCQCHRLLFHGYADGFLHTIGRVDINTDCCRVAANRIRSGQLNGKIDFIGIDESSRVPGIVATGDRCVCKLESPAAASPS